MKLIQPCQLVDGSFIRGLRAGKDCGSERLANHVGCFVSRKASLVLPRIRWSRG